jgi:chorismate-pyruvate lyase
MPIQVHGVLVHAMSLSELSRVRTEFRHRLADPSALGCTDYPLGNTLTNQVRANSRPILISSLPSLAKRD